MRVFVVGSSNYQGALEEKLFAAASQIGAALVDRGHTILIGSQDEGTLDFEVVQAAKAKAPGQARRIEIHEPEEDRPRLDPDTTFVSYPFRDWNVVQMETLGRCDAVLLIGGGETTFRAGMAAHMLRKPVIPVASFGGAAKTVWSYASGKREEFYQGGLEDLDIDGLADSWKEERSVKLVVDSLERVRTAFLRRLTSRTVVFSAVALMLIGMASWMYCLSFGLTMPWELAIFLSVCFAGLTGASVKSVRDLRTGSRVTPGDLLLDAALGVGAGFISAVLYLVVETAVTGSLSPTKTPADYTRVALLLGVMGIFAGMFVDAAFERFESVKKSVLAGELGKRETTPAKRP